MCGIAGIVGDFDWRGTAAALDSMSRAQAHRGPDDAGVEILLTGAGVVGLAHRRLAILDRSPLGHQPMKDPETGNIIVFNGEIYNYRELRREMESEGFRFASHSDTEVLLKAFGIWGIGCLDHLRGMFALALWESRSQNLWVAVDPLGIKPLYYAETAARGFVFASEVRAIAQSGLIGFDIEPRSLAGYFAYGSVQAPQTILKRVRSLEPGTWMRVSGAGEILESRRYWQFPAIDVSVRSYTPEIGEMTRALLTKAIVRHTVSDVPLMLFLSSGIDSTTIAGILAKAIPGSLRALTISFRGMRAMDEGPEAAETARRFHIPHITCDVSDDAIAGLITMCYQAMDQPSIDGLNTYVITRAAREQGGVVAISGLGGDEVFGGYPAFRDVPALLRILRLCNFLPPDFRERLARLVSFRKSVAYRQKLIDMARAGGSVVDLYFHRRRVCSDSQLRLLGLHEHDVPFEESLEAAAKAVAECVVPGDPIASVARLECSTYLRNTLLRDTDVYSMANSFEVRVPLLDRDLVEGILRMPGGLLVSRKSMKSLLLNSCGDLLPDYVVHREKRGFNIPLCAWMRGRLSELTAAGVDSALSSGFLHVRGIKSLLAEYAKEPEGRLWSRVWALATFGHWLNRWRSHTTRSAFTAGLHATEGMRL